MTSLPSFTIDNTTHLYEITGGAIGDDLTAAALSKTRVVFSCNIPSGSFLVFNGDMYRTVSRVYADVGEDGTIQQDGFPVRLLANDDALSVSSIQWTVNILAPAAGGSQEIEPWTFDAPAAGSVVDLALTTPVPSVDAVGVVRGPKGDPVDDVQIVGGKLVFYVDGVAIGEPLDIGEITTVVDWDSIDEKPDTFPPTIGSTATTAVAGNDARLADQRSPLDESVSVSKLASDTLELIHSGTGDMLASVYDPNSVAADAFNQDNMVSGSTNTNYTATEKSKLAGVADSADVTDAASVEAAGAFMAANVVDEDDMASDSATMVPTQQSVKAYVLAHGSSGGGGSLTDLGVTATAAELNTLDGITASTAELNFTDGVTSGIQGQLDGKQAADADLTAVAGLSPADGDVLQRKSGAWTNRTPAQLKTDLALTSADVGLGSVDNTSDATKNTATAELKNKTISGSANALSNIPESAVTNLATDLAARELLSNKSASTTLGTSDSLYPTQNAVKVYVDTAMTGVFKDKGATDCSANPNYPSASKGDAYVVTVAGKIGGASGKSVEVGDLYLATADNAGGTEASVGTSWAVLEHNLVGALLAANNLSDVTNAATARSNLGLGSIATLAAPSGSVVGTTDTQVVTNKDLTSTTNTFPTLNQNTTGSAAKLSTARTLITNLASAAAGSFDGSANATIGVTGTLPVAYGGTGAGTVTGVLVGNGTSPVTAVTAPAGDIVGTTGTQIMTNKTLSTGCIVSGTVSVLPNDTSFAITDHLGGVRVAQFSVSSISASTTRTFTFPDASGVLALTTVTTNTQTGTTYTLALADGGAVVEMNNAATNTVTIPPSSSVAFPVGTVIEIHQYGTGQTTIAAGTGVTLHSPASKVKLSAQYSSATLRLRATDEWALAGDLSA